MAAKSDGVGTGTPDGASTRDGAGAAAATRPVKNASTVLLVREAASTRGVEVFMQVRASTMAFASGAAVFPGGGVDPSDFEGSSSWGTLRTPEGETQVVRHDAADAEDSVRAGAIVAAAIRECFEECGVLLARPDGRAGWPARTLLAADRAALEGHAASLGSVLGSRALEPDLFSLREVDRWITPAGEPRRYDTHFFVAGLPREQEPDGRTSESVRSFWTSPDQALERYAGGDLFLMPPTWAQLARLAEADSLERAMTPASTGITQPTVEREDGVAFARFWGTDDYRAAGPRR